MEAVLYSHSSRGPGARGGAWEPLVFSLSLERLRGFGVPEEGRKGGVRVSLPVEEIRDVVPDVSLGGPEFFKLLTSSGEMLRLRAQTAEEARSWRVLIRGALDSYLESGEEFLEALDNEDKSTLVMIHIYEHEVPGCEAMRGSLLCLAQEYPLVKFCCVRSGAISTSALFRGSALPALLVYKAGDLIGNFVRVTDQLGEDFFAVDVEALLQEYGLLPDKPATVMPKTIRNGAIVQHLHEDDDSDLEID
jgi:hypothetical protein